MLFSKNSCTFAPDFTSDIRSRLCFSPFLRVELGLTELMYGCTGWVSVWTSRRERDLSAWANRQMVVPVDPVVVFIPLEEVWGGGPVGSLGQLGSLGNSRIIAPFTGTYSSSFG